MPSDDIPAFDPALAWLADWPLRSMQLALQAQQMQFEAWHAWLSGWQSWSGWQGGLLDWWTGRLAGGVPLDG